MMRLHPSFEGIKLQKVTHNQQTTVFPEFDSVVSYRETSEYRCYSCAGSSNACPICYHMMS